MAYILIYIKFVLVITVHFHSGYCTEETCIQTCSLLDSGANPLMLIDGAPIAALDAEFNCPEVGSTAKVTCPDGQQLFAIFGTNLEQCSFGSFKFNEVPNTKVAELQIQCSSGGWVTETGRSFTSLGCSPCPSGWRVPYDPHGSAVTEEGISNQLIPSCSGSPPDPIVLATQKECIDVCAKNTQCFSSYYVPSSKHCYINLVSDLDCPNPIRASTSQTPECSTNVLHCSFTVNKFCVCPAGSNDLDLTLFKYLGARLSNGLSDGELYKNLCCQGVPPIPPLGPCPDFSPVPGCM